MVVKGQLEKEDSRVYKEKEDMKVCVVKQVKMV
jgi:hypothetical protein